MSISLSAFQGNPALLSQCIERLQTCLREGNVKPGSLAWDGVTGSVVGCIIRSADVAVWEAELGLPQWLAVMLDVFGEYSASPPEAVASSITFLEAIAVGANVEPSGSRLVLRFLDDVDRVAPHLHDTVRIALAEVRQLHERSIAGAAASAQQWREVRRRAASATDLTSNSIDRACANCVETAAWDPARSASTVFDTFRVWRNVQYEHASMLAGWNERKDKVLNDLMQGLYERFVAGHATPPRSVFQILTELHPEEAALLESKSARDVHTFTSATGRASALMLELLNSG